MHAYINTHPQWERAKLIITDPNMRPKAAWARKVPYKVHSNDPPHLF